MKNLLKLLGFAALALTIVPPSLVVAGMLSEGSMKLLLAIGAVLWFATAPLWMKSEET